MTDQYTRELVDLDLMVLWDGRVQDSMAVMLDLMVSLDSYLFCKDLTEFMDSLAQDLKGHLASRDRHDSIQPYLKDLMVLTSQPQGLTCSLAFKVHGSKM